LDNATDPFFTDGNQQSYFTNSSNNNNNNIKPVSSSQAAAINRPTNNINKSTSSFGNDANFMNSSSTYHVTGYHHQISTQDQVKGNLPSVTPPISGSSFFNNTSGIISSNY